MTALVRRLPSALLALAVGVVLMLAAIHFGVRMAGADAGPTVVLDAGPALDVPASGPEIYAPARAADPAPAPSSPVVTATDTTETAWQLIEQHGPIWGGMLLLFGLAAAFLRRNEKERWLGAGKHLAVVVGLTGVLGSVLEAGVNGGTWAGVIVTVVAAIKLFLSPTPQAAKAG